MYYVESGRRVAQRETVERAAETVAVGEIDRRSRSAGERNEKRTSIYA